MPQALPRCSALLPKRSARSSPARPAGEPRRGSAWQDEAPTAPLPSSPEASPKPKTRGQKRKCYQGFGGVVEEGTRRRGWVLGMRLLVPGQRQELMESRAGGSFWGLESSPKSCTCCGQQGWTGAEGSAPVLGRNCHGEAAARASPSARSIPVLPPGSPRGLKGADETGRGRKGEGRWGAGGRAAGRIVSLHSSFICRFIKSRANFDIISFKQLHLAGVWNLFEIKKTITERQQSSKTTSET